MNLKNSKHVFLAAYNCIFIINIIKNLIARNILSKESVLIATHDSYNNYKSIIEECNELGFDNCSWKELLHIQKENIISVNPMSLHTKNSFILIELLNKNLITEKNINILITDDEVDRWHKLFQKKGKLELSDKYLIDEHLLNLLTLDINYLCPNSIGEIISKVCKKKIRSLDVTLPFTILDLESLSNVEKTLKLNTNPHEIKSSKKIMFHTKPSSISRGFIFPLKLLYFFLFIHKPNKNKVPIKLGLWLKFKSKNLFLLQFVIFLIFKIKKEKIDINLINRMATGKYLLTLYEYDTLILQARGGFSTAKFFAEKIGRVVVGKNTPNFNGFKLDYKHDPLAFNNFNEALKLALTDFDQTKQKEVSKKIDARHSASLIKLKTIWHITNA